MITFLIALGVGVIIIGPLAAILNSMILSCCKKQTCCAKCLRTTMLSEDMTEVENDLELLRNLWLAEETTSQEYHSTWKKGVLATVVTY